MDRYAPYGERIHVIEDDLWEIDGAELDEGSLHRLGSGDPSLTSLNIRRGLELGKLERAGQLIAKSDRLKDLQLSIHLGIQDSLQALCGGLSQNRSIERLHIKEWPNFSLPTLINSLLDFFENNLNLRALRIDCGMLPGQVDMLFDALRGRRRGDYLVLNDLYCNDDDDGMLSPRMGIEFGRVVGQQMNLNLEEGIAAATQRAQLKSCFESDGDKVLRGSPPLNKIVELVGNSISQVTRLDLAGVSFGRASTAEKCLQLLAASVKNHKLLKKLSMKGARIAPAGWRIFAGSLDSNDVLEDLCLAETNIGDEGVGYVADALAKNTRLKTLDMNCNESVNAAGWIFFFERMWMSSPSLEVVDFGENSIDDEGVVNMADAFSNAGSLRVLKFEGNNDISGAGWQSHANSIISLTLALESLDISYTGLGDAAAAVIGEALAGATKLRKLYLSNVGATSAGWRSLLSFTQNQHCSLDYLSLGDCSLGGHDIGTISALAAKRLQTLNLGRFNEDAPNEIYFTRDGWEALLSTRLRNPSYSLKALYLFNSNIDDHTMGILASALENNSSLKYLDLSENRSISTLGWQMASTILRNPKSSLKKLYLKGNDIDRESARKLARALKNNRSLKELDLSNSIAGGDCGGFSRLLCNCSSISAVQRSNHHLQGLGALLHLSLPRKIRLSLEMNGISDKNEVAREKILRIYPTNSNINAQDFDGIGLSSMPRVLALFGQNNVGISVLYQLLRSTPDLRPGNRERGIGGTKRKRLGTFVGKEGDD